MKTLSRCQIDILPEPLVAAPQGRVAEDASCKRMPRLELATRPGPVLHPSPLAEQPGVLSVNLTRGCVHQCAFCSVRGRSSYQGDEVVYLFTDTTEHIKEELSKARRLPKSVYISPSMDPFPPLAEVQEESLKVVDVLAAHGVESWLMTRGYIRPTILQGLAAFRERVKVTVGITTLNRGLQRIIEPLAAPPNLRLRQIRQLREHGIAVHVALEPLVPGLTDTRENLTTLLRALADLGVRRVFTSYIFLRTGIRENLVRALEPNDLAEPVLDAFAGGPVLSGGKIDSAQYIPKAKRQRGYATLMALAAAFDISVSVSPSTNPDFQPSHRGHSESERQHLLFPGFGRVRKRRSMLRTGGDAALGAVS